MRLRGVTGSFQPFSVTVAATSPGLAASLLVRGEPAPTTVSDAPRASRIARWVASRDLGALRDRSAAAAGDTRQRSA